MDKSNLLLQSVFYIIMGLLAFGWRLYHHRSWINRLRKEGMPMPESWSWISGHIFVVYRYTQSLPPLSNVNLVFPRLAVDFADSEMYLLDIWPMGEAMLVIFNPEAAIQVAQKLKLPKAKSGGRMVLPITGGPSLLSMNGEQWKTWRSLFNPGFSTGTMTELLPHVIDSVSIFCDKLEENSEKGLLYLDDLTTRLTFDVIMKVTLDADIDHQHSDHVLPRAFGHITRWHSFWDARILLNPLRPFVQGYFGHLINSYIHKELEKRYQELNQERAQSLSRAEKKTKSVITLAMEAYVSRENEGISRRLDPHFAKILTNQIRLFLFAGNDTTSSSIVFAYHLLSKHRAALAQLQKEHDTIFGTDPSRAALRLKEQPSLVQQCNYTLAVIRETLRLYPPAATMRSGTEGTFLPSRTGVLHPINGITVLISHHTMHRNPRLWPQPNVFLPERWLVDPDHELYPPSGAYRAFELGPRNCIGQTLTLNEMRVVLIMTVRKFKIMPAYEEFDKMQALNKGMLGKLALRVGWGGERVRTLDGERAFPTEKAGAHPSEGYPCRVTFRD